MKLAAGGVKSYLMHVFAFYSYHENVPQSSSDKFSDL